MSMTKTFAVASAIAALALPASALAEETTPPSPTQNASETCKAQRTALGKTVFNQMYGIKAKSNGIGKCVSKLRPAETKAASKSNADCTAEQTADKAGFDAKYGTGKKDKNAYKKCVIAKRKAAHAALKTATVTASKNAAKECKSERSADKAAFDKAYKNFGKCVSTKAKAKNDAPAPAPTA
jgi:hypothetical protein